MRRVALDRDNLRGFLVSELGIDTEAVEDSTPLFSSNLVDSFSLVELIMFVEKEAGFRMNPGDVTLDNLDSIEKIVAFVESKG